MHAASNVQCYLLSVTTFAGMAVPHAHGPYIGLLLAGWMPAFMRCPICPPNFTGEECADFQRINGCHACDRRGCWQASSSCLFFARARSSHQDAGWGDSVPHMRETVITCTADGLDIEGRLSVDWWRHYQDVCFCINGADQFSMGKASGDQCNCLIDTLRQQMNLECDTRAVRNYVQARHSNLVLGDFLEFQQHWRDVLSGLGHVAGRNIDPSVYKVVCVDAQFIGNGDVEGNGVNILYIARQNANHFVPLLRRNAGEDDNSASVDNQPNDKASDGGTDVESTRFCDGSCDQDDITTAEIEPPEFSLNDSCEGNTKAAETAARALAGMRSLASAVATAKLERDGVTEAASGTSSAASQDEGSDDEASSSAYDSDATDLFHLEVEPAATWETIQDKDTRVAHLLASQMRRHPLVPAQPDDETSISSFIAVQSRLKLPAAHCAFRGCCWTGSTKGSIEEHVVREHSAQLLAAEKEVYGNGSHYGSSRQISKAHYSLNM